MIYKVAAVRKHDLVPKSINHKIHLSFINLDFKLLSFIYFFFNENTGKKSKRGEVISTYFVSWPVRCLKT